MCWNSKRSNAFYSRKNLKYYKKGFDAHSVFNQIENIENRKKNFMHTNIYMKYDNAEKNVRNSIVEISCIGNFQLIHFRWYFSLFHARSYIEYIRNEMLVGAY